MNTQVNKDKSALKITGIILLAILIICLVGAAFILTQAINGFGLNSTRAFFFEEFMCSADPYGRFGTFGDFIGGVLNPFFAFFTLLGLLWTIYMQRKELGYTRDELEETRKEVKRSADAFEYQNFDNSFFNLINMLELSKQGMSVSDDTGYKAIRKLLVLYNQGITVSHEGRFVVNRDIIEPYGLTKDDYRHRPDIVELAYTHNFIQMQHSNLGHYFGTLTNIFKYIEDEGSNKIDGFSDNKYIQLIASSISPDETCLIFLYCLTEEGKEVKSLSEKYKLLEKLPQNFSMRDNTVRTFDVNAFGKNQYWKDVRGNGATQKLHYVEQNLKN